MKHKSLICKTNRDENFHKYRGFFSFTYLLRSIILYSLEAGIAVGDPFNLPMSLPLYIF